MPLEQNSIENKANQTQESITKVLQKEYPNLSPDWRKQIETAAKGVALKELAPFLRQTKKYTKGLPQSLVATALVGYLQNSKNQELSVSAYANYLAQVKDQHEKLKGVYQLFQTNPELAKDFQNFKKRRGKNYGSLKDIQQSKGFTNDTYDVFQYLISTDFQQKKEKIVGNLSQQDRAIFAAYIQTDARIANVIAITPTELGVRGLGSSVERNLQSSSEKKDSFQNAYNRFSADFDSPNGPGKIVDAVFGENDQLFGKDWLSKEQYATLAEQLAQNSDEEIMKLLQPYQKLFPQGVTGKNIITYLHKDTKSDKQPDISGAQEALMIYFQNTFVHETQSVVKQTVMKEYFSYVSRFLQAGGEVVELDSTPNAIVYGKDGEVTMNYKTQSGIQGMIVINPDGDVTVTDFFAKRGSDETQDNPLIMQKRQRKLDGTMPSMQRMIHTLHGASQQMIDVYSDTQKNHSSGSYKELLQKNIGRIGCVDADMQTSYDVMKNSISHTLNMTQFANSLVENINHIETVGGNKSEQSEFLKYIKGEQKFLDRNVHTQYEPFFVLRDTLDTMPDSQVEKTTAALQGIYDVYRTLPKEQQFFSLQSQDMLSSAPIDADKRVSFMNMLSMFCVDGNFDSDQLQVVSNYIIKNKPRNFEPVFMVMDGQKIDGSLFAKRYPKVKEAFAQEKVEEVDKENQIAGVMQNTRNSLDDLDLSVRLDKTEIA